MERSAAQDVLRCYCSGNQDGQTILASTIAPSGHSMTDNGGEPMSYRESFAVVVRGWRQMFQCPAQAQARLAETL